MVLLSSCATIRLDNAVKAICQRTELPEALELKYMLCTQSGSNLIIDMASQAAKAVFAMPTVLPVIRSLDQVLSGNSPGSATA